MGKNSNPSLIEMPAMNPASKKRAFIMIVFDGRAAGSIDGNTAGTTNITGELIMGVSVKRIVISGIRIVSLSGAACSMSDVSAGE